MAQIYAKPTTTGTEKCLVLEPSEALLYPFNAGNWTDLRIAFSLSATNAGELNGLYLPGSMELELNNPATRAWCGLKNSTNNNLPSSGDTRFIGITNDGAESSFGYGYTLGVIDNPYLCIDTGASFLFGPGPLLWVVVPTVEQCEDTTNYTQVHRMRFQVVNRGAPEQQVIVSAAYYNGVEHSVSIPDLRYRLAAYNESTWTVDYLGELPDAFFFRMPWIESRFRMHALVIERFA